MAKQYVEVGTLILALVIVWLLFAFIRDPMVLVVNSIFAIVILFVLNMFLEVSIPINILTVLVVAVGGILGLILILLLRFSNIAFNSEMKG